MAKTAEVKMVQIKLPKAKKYEENFITASVNGKVYKIMRGVEVEVPENIAKVIERSAHMQDMADAYVVKTAQ